MLWSDHIGQSMSELDWDGPSGSLHEQAMEYLDTFIPAIESVNRHEELLFDIIVFTPEEAIQVHMLFKRERLAHRHRTLGFLINTADVCHDIARERVQISRVARRRGGIFHESNTCC